MSDYEPDKEKIKKIKEFFIGKTIASVEDDCGDHVTWNCFFEIDTIMFTDGSRVELSGGDDDGCYVYNIYDSNGNSLFDNFKRRHWEGGAVTIVEGIKVTSGWEDTLENYATIQD